MAARAGSISSCARGWEVVVTDAVERGRSGWMRIPEETGGVPVTLTLENPWERFRIGPGTPQQGRGVRGPAIPGRCRVLAQLHPGLRAALHDHG